MPPLDPETLTGLRESIKRYGVLVPVVADLDGNVLDGHHRLAIADELDVIHPLVVIAPMPTTYGVPREEAIKVDKQRTAIKKKAKEVIHNHFETGGLGEVIEVADDADVAEIARSLNLDRRHLTTEQRLDLTAELRAKGTSIRAIAKATGVSKTQVGRDIEQVSPTGHVNPDGPPDAPVVRNIDTPRTVTGTDGKTYKAKVSKPKTRKLKYTGPSLEELAERTRAYQREIEPEVFRQTCVRFVKMNGWEAFARITQELSDASAPSTTVPL